MWKKFTEAVDQHFRFLETEFGFTKTMEKPPVVIYESTELQLVILFDASRGHELDLGIRRLSDSPQGPRSIGIDMLMRLKEGSPTRRYLPVFPMTDEALETEVKRLAELLREYGSDVCKGDFRAFDFLDSLEVDIANEFGTTNDAT